MTTHIPRLTRANLAWIAIGTEGGMLILALGIAWLLGISVWAQVNPSWQTAAWGIAAAVPPLVIVIGIAESNTRFGEMSRRDFGPVIELFRNANVFDLLYVSILAGLGEEVLFRAVIQVGLESWLGTAAALAIASLVFGLAHAMSRSYFLFATLIGLYFGGLLLWTGSLLVPMLAHAVYDFIALLYGTRWSTRFSTADIAHAE